MSTAGSSGPPRRSFHLLVVDDSISVQEAVRDALRDVPGLDISTCGHAAAATEILEARAADLVLCDVILPGRSGYDFCRMLKASSDGPPVFLLVSAFEPFSEEEARAAGSDGVLGKPFTGAEIRARIEPFVHSAAARLKTPGAVAARVVAVPAAETLTEVTSADLIPPDLAQPSVLDQLSNRIMEPLAQRLLEPVTERLAHRLQTEGLEATVQNAVRQAAERLVKRRLDQLEAESHTSHRSGEPTD